MRYFYYHLSITIRAILYTGHIPTHSCFYTTLSLHVVLKQTSVCGGVCVLLQTSAIWPANKAGAHCPLACEIFREEPLRIIVKEPPEDRAAWAGGGR